MQTPISTIRRWWAFNAVGAAGVLVQLAALAVLLKLGLHYLAATAVAVEAAILHNFAWHQRWTWRDRPAGRPAALLRRLARFHALNGAVSLAGNVLLVAALTGLLGVPPLAASATAIVVCAALNFAASERLVFAAAAGALAVLPAATLHADGGPRPATLAAWNAYQATVDARYAAHTSEGTFFIQDAAGSEWRRRMLAGEVTTRRIDAPDVPGGRIHHWAGGVLVRGVTVAQLVERLQQQAGREADTYDDVIASRLLERDGDRLRVFMKLRRTTVLTATFDTEHEVVYRRLGTSRASSRSIATRIVELADAGTPRERPREADRGFLWKLNAYWRFEQTEAGVIVECESVSLSRHVPALLSPLAGPIVERVAREALEGTLRAFSAAGGS